MDNKEFPQEQILLPEDAGITPEPGEEETAHVLQEPSALQESDAPAAQEVSGEEEIPVIEEIPVSQEVPAVEEIPVPEEAPAAEMVPVPQELPSSEETPAPEAPCAEDAVPCTEEAPGEETSPEPEIPSDFQEITGDEDITEVTVEDTEEEELPEEEDPGDQEYRDGGQDFDELLHTPARKKSRNARKRPARKGRPKCTTGEGLWGIPNILATFVWLALILAIGVTAGRMLWVCAADVLAFGREDKPVTVTIYASDDMDAITDKLYDAGLIRYKSLFNLYASISDAQEDIKPGIYDLNTRYDYHALVNFMSPRSSREVIELTIPEGYTCRQIFALLEENRVCTAVDAAAWAANGELDDYWFLEGLERGTENCLEGYLFPDTYEFYKNSTPREALQRMLNNFEYRFDEEMRARIDTLNAELTGNYTIREIAIVASLIEKESAAPGESPMIAGVIYNRLFRWDYPALLNIDAAIVYAQGGEARTIDTSLDSPYNTYLHAGLTPGPIANPGLASLNAALYPENHEYYFYVLNPATGMHQFSRTQAEHDAYIDQFYGN